jgi:POT family proton-dependent oligopeptide transporter
LRLSPLNLSQLTIQEKFAQSAARRGYATVPVKTTRLPPGIPYIVVSEAAERFSFYGMNAILTSFMVHNLLDANGKPDPMSHSDAVACSSLFISAVYFTPFLGAVISDAFLGKFRTVVIVSIVYCFGHLALSLNATRLGLLVGLSLIALGAGGIKPCVSSNVGDQFGADNQHLMTRVFGWFYFAINFGAFFSQIGIPLLLDHYGPHVAFGVPGLLMVGATLIFWAGRRKFVHAPPSGNTIVKDAISREGRGIIARLALLYIFFAVFWSLYYQTTSAWVLQADNMDRHRLGYDWASSQLQGINSILILVFIPLFSYVIYPFVDHFFKLTPLRKISIGFFVTVPSFLITAWIEKQISLGLHPSIFWQFIAYVFITAAEILVSITGLEFSYTQAPRKMKSFVMALFFGSITLGTFFTALVNKLNAHDGKLYLAGADYYMFFTWLMLAASVLFIFVARNFKSRPVLQDDSPAAPA